MKTAFSILSAAALTATALLSGCGGSGSENTYELPTPLARTVRIVIPDADNGDTTYILGFEIKSATEADIYVGNSPGVPASQLMVVGYKPQEDTAEGIYFYWESADDEGEDTGLQAQLVMRNCVNLTKGNGTCTCDLMDQEDTRVSEMQFNLSATIGHFSPNPVN